MGLLTDVVALGKRKPLAVLKKPYESAPWFQFKGVGELELTALAKLVGAGKTAFPVLAAHEESLLFAFPPKLAQRVAALGDAELARLRPKWSKAAGLEWISDQTELDGYLKGLRHFLSTEQGPFALFVSP